MCVSEYVHACLGGFDVGVLSGVYHGGPMAVMNLLGQRLCECVCVCCIRVQFSRWKMNVRREESIDLGASSAWCEEMSTTWTDSEQFSATI